MPLVSICEFFIQFCLVIHLIALPKVSRTAFLFPLSRDRILFPGIATGLIGISVLNVAHPSCFEY
jgi:hypothetical protein